MKMNRLVTPCALIIVALDLLVLAACAGAAEPPGILRGNVTIGPISPVERPGEPQPVPCEVYKARTVMVYDKSGKKLVEEVELECDGSYLVELPPGTYTVDINRAGIDRSLDIPRTVQIEPGTTVTLDIDIDTGIR